MAVIVRADRVRGMTRRMVRATPRVLNDWSKDQIRRLKGAYAAGGHQRHGGRRWQPEEEPGLPMLVGSGAMRRSTKARVRGTRVTLINDSPIAEFHQEGTSSLPKRPLIVVTMKDNRELHLKLKVGLERALK